LIAYQGLNMKINREILESWGACEHGIERFMAVFPDGYDGEWCQTTQMLALATDIRKDIGYAWHRGWIPQWSMAGANLSGADLSGADLSGDDLSGAKRSSYDAPIKGWELRGGILHKTSAK
jgi:hypothetical protein